MRQNLGGRRVPWLILSSIIAITLFTRWLFRSHELFSWDSANFALAMAHIDIAMHRPHPPGYVGYVIAARALDTIIRSPNTSLVVWNIVATSLAAVVLLAFFWRSPELDGRDRRAGLAGVAILLSSPMLWFYGEIAEIYPSELLVTLLVAYCAWRASLGEHRWMFWCAPALAGAMLFKLSAAVFIFPLVAYAWSRQTPATRRRSAALTLGLTGGAAVVLLGLQPDLVSVIWDQFAAATSGSRLVGSNTGTPGLALNRNLRLTFTAAISAFGVVNCIALLIWAAADRRLRVIDGRFAWLWFIPWLLLLTAVHIGRPGYLLPLLPLTCLVLGDFYARRGTALMVALIVAQAAFNVAQFAVLRPMSAEMMGGQRLYRDKTLLQRAASDLQDVTVPTAFTIRQSDRDVRALRALIQAECPSQSLVVVAGSAPVDWRRILWYFPRATAIYVTPERVEFIGTQTEFTAISPAGQSVDSDCPTVWVGSEDGGPGGIRPLGEGRQVAGIGWVTAPRRLRVSSAGISTSTGEILLPR